MSLSGYILNDFKDIDIITERQDGTAPEPTPYAISST